MRAKEQAGVILQPVTEPMAANDSYFELKIWWNFSNLDLILQDIEKQCLYESFATVGEIRVWRRADFQSGSRVLKKVF